MTTIDTRMHTPLRALYVSRFAFAVLWAALLVLSTTALSGGRAIGGVTAALLVLYPVVDLIAAVVDRRTSRSSASALLVANMALSLLAAIGLVIAIASGVGAVLAVWGAWAITAGAVQLTVGLRRRTLGGQWAMILSGGISVLAGIGFVVQSASATSVTGIAGYATLGGIFFLVSAIRQHAAR